MRRFLTGKALIIFAVVLVAAYGVYSVLFPEKSLDNLTREDRLALKKNIVVLGVDERPSEGDVGRSDTLFVVMFDQKSKKISLLSVPRDTRVRIPGYGWDKINHAYAYGGRELTQKTVEELLGIRIDNYVMVDFSGFKGLVDAIGGIDINVEKDMYYFDDWDGFKIDLKKGMQHMDGATAIQYVRYRDEEGDIGRIRRQQHFIMAVYDKITSADMLLHVPGLTKQLTTMVKTNLPISDMMDVGRALHSMVKEQGLAMAMVPGTPKYIDGVSYWLPDITKMRQEMADMQGAKMSERYKTAAETMEAEYDKAVEKAEQGDTSDENKDTPDAEEKGSKDKKDAAKKAGEDKSDKRDARRSAAKEEARAAAGEAQAESQPVVKTGNVVRLVNCSGSASAGDAAAARLQSAGFTVIRGGSGEAIDSTTVISTTNNGAVVSRLSNIPFPHKMRITRDGAADCDGVVMLGRDFK